jgi:PAS domain S-box-containing protein
MDDNVKLNNGSKGKQNNNPEHTDRNPINRWGSKPVQMLAITIAGIFLAEVVAMIVISFLGAMDYVWLVLVDALIMTTIVFPVLYILSFKPLLAYLQQRELALAELRVLQLELEQRVVQRTADLNHANRSLENEVAEGKRSEEQLAYQAWLLDNVNDAIVASDEQYRLTAWNAAAEAMYGWRAQEVLGRNGTEILDTDFITANPQEMRQKITELGRWRGDATQLRKDGERIPVEVASIVLHHPDGQIKGYVSVNRDITERKQAEETLRYQATILHSVSDAIIASDLDFNITSWNHAAEELYGWQAKEVIGKPTSEILHTEYAHEDPQEVRQNILKTGMWRGEAIQKRKDGSGIDILAAVSLVKDQNEKPIGAVTVNRDITERKRAEAALIESEKRFRNTLDNMLEGAQILNRDWRYLYLNAAAETHNRRPNQELLGQHYIEMWPNIETTHVFSVIQDCMERRIATRLENRFVYPDGAVGWFDLSIQPIPEGVFILSQDITERKRSEAEIQMLAKFPGENPNPVIRVNNEGRILYANPSSLEILNWWNCAVGEMLPDGWRQAAFETLDTGRIKEEELLCEELIYSLVITPIQDGSYVNIYGRDITKRYKAELALRQAHDELELRVQLRTEELALANVMLERINEDLVTQIAERDRAMAELRLTSAALEAAANGIFITGQRGNIRWINPAFTAMTGYSPADAIGQNPRLLKSGIHPQEYYQQMWETIQSGRVWRGEITNRRKDGSVYIEEQTITPILDEEGKITNYIAIQQDITERIQAEQALIQTNELLERYFSSIDTLIAYMNRDFNFIRVNDAYAKSAGYTVDYFLNKNHFDLYPHAENQAIFQQVVDTGEPYVVFEKPFEYPDHPDWGVTFWDWSVQPVKRPDGFVDGLVLSLVDVTGRKRAETELARQNQELLALSQVEHELREFAESLAQSTISLNSSLELEQVLVTILEQIQRAVPFTAGDILLKEGRSYRIAGTLNTRIGSEQSPPASISHSLDDFPLLDQMFTTLQPLLIASADGTAEWQRLAGLEWVRSYVGAPLVAADQVFGIINLHSDQLGAFDQKTVEQLMAYTAPAAAAMQNAWLFEQVRSSRERLQALSRRLVEVQEGERRYIASELHDEVGQALTGLTIVLQMVDKKADNPQAVRSEVAGMHRMLEGVLEDLHRLAMDLRPASLDHLGLAAALRQHVAMVNEKFGLVAQFEIVGIQDRLPDEMEIAFYRIVQEALNNVVRHARAKRVDVILEQREDSLILVIEDDGMGFDPQVTLEKNERLGLFGMRERAEMLGGTLIIESAAGKGTTLVVEVPYGDAHPDR